MQHVTGGKIGGYLRSLRREWLRVCIVPSLREIVRRKKQCAATTGTYSCYNKAWGTLCCSRWMTCSVCSLPCTQVGADGGEFCFPTNHDSPWMSDTQGSCCRKPGERLVEACARLCHIHQQCCIMVWGGISYDGHIHFVIVQPTMTNRTKDVLHPVVVTPYIRRHARMLF